jgi:hypothetical protein
MQLAIANEATPERGSNLITAEWRVRKIRPRNRSVNAHGLARSISNHGFVIRNQPNSKKTKGSNDF